MNAEELNSILPGIFTDLFTAKNPRTGKPIQFKLARNQNIYLYYRARDGKKRFCYTPHKDLDGWYYSFIYIQKNNRLTMKMLRPHRTRKAAKARALSMLEKVKKPK